MAVILNTRFRATQRPAPRDLALGEAVQTEFFETQLENATWLYARLCRRIIAQIAPTGGLKTESTTSSIVLLVPATLSADRTRITCDLRRRNADVTIEACNSAGVSYGSPITVTSSSPGTSFAQTSIGLSSLPDEDIILKIRMTADSGQVGEISHLRVIEEALLTSELPTL